MSAIIARALEQQGRGQRIAFAVVDRPSGAPVSSTGYLDIRVHDANIEIGWTWLVPSAQRTSINTECKLLLLTHAFEELAMERVCLKTDARSERSRRAILRIGASFEGVLRGHVRTKEGGMRDSACYSILRDEWPCVRRGLRSRLERSRC